MRIDRGCRNIVLERTDIDDDNTLLSSAPVLCRMSDTGLWNFFEAAEAKNRRGANTALVPAGSYEGGPAGLPAPPPTSAATTCSSTSCFQKYLAATKQIRSI